MTDVRSQIADILKCRPADLSATSALGETPGWDSFAHLAIMMALEQRYAIAITDETIRTYSRLSAIDDLAGKHSP
jgi:acyl carrier protein